MIADLPKPISDYVQANARLDLDGMLRPFAPDAVDSTTEKKDKPEEK